MTNEVVNRISERYIELYEHVTGKTFVKQDVNEAEMNETLKKALEHLPPVPQQIGTL